MARISFLHRRDGRYYLQVRMPVHDGETARTRVFRSALGTSAFVVARRRLSLCMAWIVALKDNPELPRRGAFLLAQMRGYLDRGAPVDADALAARGAMEHYVQIWLTECRVFDCNPGEICPGFTETWKEFVAQNVAGETGHRAKAEDDSFRRGFAVGRQTALGDVETRTTAAAVGADQADVGRGARDDFLRRDVNLTPGHEFPIGAIRRFVAAEPNDAMSSPFGVDEFIAPVEQKEVAVPPKCSGAGLAAPTARADRVSEAPGRAEVETASNATIDVGDLAELDEFLPEPTDPLSVALEKFLGREKKRHGDDRARERVGLVVPFVIAVIGDKPVSAITRRELGKIDLALPDIPTRTNIPKEHCVSLAARYLYAKKNGWEGLQRLAENTLSNRYHTTLNTFFEWLYQREALHEQPYRFEFVQKDNPEQVDRDVFSPEEAIKLVNLPLFTGCESLSRVWNPGELFVQDARYWGYVLALVTGMRPAEIAQIRCRDLIAIEDEGELVWFVDFTDRMMNVKSKNARRMIPLVPLVIELGLAKRRDLLIEAGHERLFPSVCAPAHRPREIVSNRYLWVGRRGPPERSLGGRYPAEAEVQISRLTDLTTILNEPAKRRWGTIGMSRILLLSALVAIGASSAQASCETNFSSQGVPLLTPLSYKTWMLFPKLDAKKALDRLASAVLAEGYSDMNVDKAYGAITALQETTGSGLPQTLRIVARKVNAGTRVDAFFSIQAGQVTTEELVRGSLCKLIAAAVD